MTDVQEHCIQTQPISPDDRIIRMQAAANMLNSDVLSELPGSESVIDSEDALLAVKTMRTVNALRVLSENYTDLQAMSFDDEPVEAVPTPLTDAEKQVVADNLPLVVSVARSVVSKLPRHFDLDDLVSMGIDGLIDAVSRFDDSRGTVFEAYASHRIKGSIIDAIRKQDWIPRSVRINARRLDVARESLEFRLGRTPTNTEIAEELEISLTDLHKMRYRVSRGQPLSFESKDRGRLQRGHSIEETTGDPTSLDLTEQIVDQETAIDVRAALAQLTDKERYVIEAHDFEGLTLQEVGDNIGLTESRICQIRTKALDQLRRLLTPR